MAANKPKIDYSTYAGKLKILRDVKDLKYPLPKNFPTLAELDTRNKQMQSSHYQKTAMRRKEIDAKRDRL